MGNRNWAGPWQPNGRHVLVRRSFRIAVLAATGLVGASSVSSVGSNRADAAPLASSQRTCADAPAGFVACHARLVTNGAGQVMAGSRGVNPHAFPPGLHPADLKNAYKLPAAAAVAGQTIAIVDAYDNPHAEANLAVYRARFGLPPCTTANGCFKKVNQFGAPAPLPVPDVAWGAEIALDLDMVSAICPNCKILLVLATTNSFANIATATRTASARARIVSHSYGGSEFAGQAGIKPSYV